MAAILYFNPSEVELAKGESTWIDIMVDTEGENINAVAAYFRYPAEQVRITSIETNSEVMELVIEEEVEAGVVKLSGGKPNPGFSGTHKIGAVALEGQADAGTGTLTFEPGAAVLRNADSEDVLDEAAEAQLQFGAQLSTDDLSQNLANVWYMLALGGVLIAVLIAVAVMWSKKNKPQQTESL